MTSPPGGAQCQPRRPTETIVVPPTSRSTEPPAAADERPSTASRRPLSLAREISTDGGGTVVHLPRPEQAPSVTHHLELVDQQLDEVLADLHHLWSTKLAPAGESADILGADDLPPLLAAQVHSGGK